MNLVALNAGSSSLKAACYTSDDGHAPVRPPKALWEARANWNQVPGHADMRIRSSRGAPIEKRVEIASHRDVFRPVLETLRDIGKIDVAGHRIVHGGAIFRNSVLITPEVKTAIAGLSSLAPIHNQLELDGVSAVEEVLGSSLPQVAVFDTAFHATLPPAAYVYAGPHAWLEQKIRRYGFHGISHQYTAIRAAEMLGKDVKSLQLISCHLGSGCSLAAIKNGCSIDTTMGFTPLDGLMMGTRSGSVDPGILTHLLKQHGCSAEQIEHTLNYESGLRGVSGISSDMREILDAIAGGNQRAQLAFDVYVHSARRHVGAMLASLERLDALIFTAGVGENSPEVRAGLSDGLRSMGVSVDPEKNCRRDFEGDISSLGSPVRVLVVQTQEEWEIARECLRVVNGKEGET